MHNIWSRVLPALMSIIVNQSFARGRNQTSPLVCRIYSLWVSHSPNAINTDIKIHLGNKNICQSKIMNVNTHCKSDYIEMKWPDLFPACCDLHLILLC